MEGVGVLGSEGKRILQQARGVEGRKELKREKLRARRDRGKGSSLSSRWAWGKYLDNS